MLESVELLNRPTRGLPLSMSCGVYARGMSGRESLVTIADAAKVQDSARITWASDDERQAVTLEVVPKVGGWTEYVAHVESASVAANNSVGVATDLKESSLTANEKTHRDDEGKDAALLSRSLTVHVAEHRTRVLFFEGEPTWEGKFIRRALERAEMFDVDYFAQVSRAATVGLSESIGAKESAERSGAAVKSDDVKSGGGAKDRTSDGRVSPATVNAPEARLHAALGSAARLADYDCIIVGATPNAMLSQGEAVRLREWVEHRGGGLIVLGGNNFAGSVMATNGKLAALLPAEIVQRGLANEAQRLPKSLSETEDKAGGVALTPTEAGAASALRGYLKASIEANNAKAKSATQNNANMKRASVLSGEGFRLGQLRPGASVLAVSGAASADGTSEAGLTLVAAMRDGAGRVIAFAPADSWRIQTNASDEVGASDNEGASDSEFAALWKGLVWWAASDAEAAVEIALNTDMPSEGSEVIAEIRARDAAFAPLKIERIAARCQLLTDSHDKNSLAVASPQEVAFTPDVTDASIWRASFIMPARGRYALQVDYTVNGKINSATKLFGVTSPLPLEDGAARDTLERTARETGGDIYAASNARTLALRLAALSHQRPITQRTFHLRTWWPLAFIITLLLCAAWLKERWGEGGRV
jgi:hypothetical protein